MLRLLIEKARNNTKTNRPLDKGDIKNLEVFLDKIFKDIGIDVDLMSPHFISRVKERTKQGDVSFDDMKKIFTGAYNKHKYSIINKANNDSGFNAVLKDLSKFLNVPIRLGKDETPNDETPLELRAKTFMKKKNFVSKDVVWQTD